MDLKILDGHRSCKFSNILCGNPKCKTSISFAPFNSKVPVRFPIILTKTFPIAVAPHCGMSTAPTIGRNVFSAASLVGGLMTICLRGRSGSAPRGQCGQ